MPWFRRQDALLLTGLVVAFALAFAGRLPDPLDRVRQVERELGLRLLLPLVVLTAVYVLNVVLKRRQMQAQTVEAQDAISKAERRASELEWLVAYGQALAHTLELEPIRTATQVHLPNIAGTTDVWVLLRNGRQWDQFAGAPARPDEITKRELLAERLLSGTFSTSEVGEITAFALVFGGVPLGVLGVRPQAGALSSDRVRAIEAAVALLSVSLKNAQLLKEVKETNLRDALTGCDTRAHAIEKIDAELRRARRGQTSVSVIIFDLDHFKDINDRYGHLCGDAVLASVGKRMRDVLRGSDLKCRYGGEEFLVLLPETPLNGARRVAETLRRALADRPVTWSGDSIIVTASFGITQAMPGEINLEAIIARADAALYRAKQDGRNCVRIAQDTLTLISER